MAAVIPRKRHRQVAEINVVPYIDVMLVLLVIFMVTAPLITAGVQVELPVGEAEPLPQDEETPLIASIDKDGLYYLTYGEQQDKALAEEDLRRFVQAYLQENPKTPVMVNGDRSVSYDQVMTLMVLLKGEGVESVGLMVDSSEQ
ncbi:MAG: protein TolR [Pseudomonadota bacterium]